MKKIYGFTLAEVLITLSILGVVAAIMIPNMIQRYQERATVTKLQKAYAELNHLAMNIAVNTDCFGQLVSCAKTKLFPQGVSTNGQTAAENFIKASGLNATVGINKVQIYQMSKLLDKTVSPYYTNTYSIKVNGNNQYEFLVIQNAGTPYNSQCQWNNGSDDYILLLILVDLKAKEYIMGKNTFAAILHDNFEISPVIATGFGRFCPAGKGSYTSTDSLCKPDASQHKGISCLSKIIKDGWKITYKY